MSRPLQAHIDLAALQNNLQVARRAAPHSRIMAVIKANGYGHGLLRVARALAQADGFAVLSIAEARALREAGFGQKILLLEGFFEATELTEIVALGLDCVVHSEWQVRLLEAQPVAKALNVFVKLNSGMNRLGFVPEQFAATLRRLQTLPGIGEINLMTHFARADEANGIAGQLAVFSQVTKDIGLPASLANSAALLRYPASHADWVRPGIMLYGCSPFADTGATQLGLQPAMTLTSRIIAVQDLAVGQQLGYGALFVADRSMRIGVVACGYADGYPRHAPTGTPILVAGKRSRTLGRVSMDMLFADLSDLPGAGVGSTVTLWGKGLPVEEVAHAAGTISYELLCTLAPRVPVFEHHG